jgi:hypothetical protein
MFPENNAAQQADLLDRTSRLLTGVHATATSLAAEPAVLMMAGVTLAFLGANSARFSAHCDCSPKNLLIRTAPPRGERACNRAHVSTIKAKPNALAKLRHHVLCKAGI